MQLNQQQYEIYTGISSFYDPLVKTENFSLSWTMYFQVKYYIKLKTKKIWWYLILSKLRLSVWKIWEKIWSECDNFINKILW